MSDYQPWKTVDDMAEKYPDRRKNSYRKDSIDVIIPCYKAHKTLLRTLSSIATQTVLDKIYVTLVNDNCPDGNYHEYIEMFSPFMDIREIEVTKNHGPGVARQIGIDNGDCEYFTCIDADDTFASAIAVETLMHHLSQSPVIKCVSSVFIQLGEEFGQIVPHQRDMVWMFGKAYRREYIEKMKVRFNRTRANEDTGFNTWVRLLASNQNEQVFFANETTYFWHNKEDSITRVKDGQYGYDQCQVGWTTNMIRAAKEAKKVRPFAESIAQHGISCMIQLYFTTIEIHERKPVFMDQIMQCARRFYAECYKDLERDITDGAFSEVFSMCSMERWGSGSLLGIVPYIGIKEWMEEVKSEEYSEDKWYDIWQALPEDLRQNNVDCGVCPAEYWIKPDPESTTADGYMIL